MQHLALFRIKDTTFDYARYGLTDVFFSVDITKSVSASKGVSVTQYAVLDGTTRIDTVSRAPGTINFQGKIGDVHHAPSLQNFVKSYGSKTRAELQLELLEALRDQAIVVDVITESKTYRNYIIESIGSGISEFGIMDVTLTMREFLTFCDEIDIKEDNREVLDRQPMSSLVLENFDIDTINNDRELIRETAKIVMGSTLTIPYIISFGQPAINPDLNINRMGYVRGTLKTTNFGNSVRYDYTYPKVLLVYPAYEQVSGYVKDNIKLQISIDLMTGNLVTESVKSVTQTRPVYGLPKFPETGKYSVTIKLIQKINNVDTTLYSTVNKDIITSPLFSNVINGINPLTDNSSPGDDYVTSYGSVSAHEMALNFIRKCSQNTYRVVPNLLKHAKMGYMYPAFYETTDWLGVKYLNMSFVYIHPDALDYIKAAYEKQFNKPGHFMNGKTMIWW